MCQDDAFNFMAAEQGLPDSTLRDASIQCFPGIWVEHNGVRHFSDFFFLLLNI